MKVLLVDHVFLSLVRGSIRMSWVGRQPASTTSLDVERSQQQRVECHDRNSMKLNEKGTLSTKRLGYRLGLLNSRSG